MTDRPIWFKSSYSNNGGACVEVAASAAAPRSAVSVRDSKHVEGPILTFSPEAFAGLVTFARNADLG
ncbi:DUF397 domain-containing protein [Streptomyces sp. NPDC048290]|uniref:DUF397 domain-containing protein n=1 Tax=Streptomyces sp. NPDC048290 TaxID=3155811 RepID=UPI003439F4CF